METASERRMGNFILVSHQDCFWVLRILAGRWHARGTEMEVCEVSQVKRQVTKGAQDAERPQALEPWFSTGSGFVPLGTFWQCLEILLNCHNGGGGATGI